MMYCIVPLAGLDFILKDNNTVKPLLKIDNDYLINKTLKNRSWYKNGTLSNANIIFVLRKTNMTEQFINFLNINFVGCKISIISDMTSGAMMSVLAGVSMISNYNIPICIDLIDIIYECQEDVVNIMNNSNIDGIIPYFESSKNCFSYLDIINGYVKQIAEKKVISSHASAGTYFFKNTQIFLESVAKSLKMDKILSYKNLMFIAPLYNMLSLYDRKILPIFVEKVKIISKDL